MRAPGARYRAQSSIGFAAPLDGSKKTVISLFPGKSTAAEGLAFILYTHRYGGLSGLSGEEVERLMPTKRQPYYPGSEYEGFEGFLVSREEIDRLAQALPPLRVM